MECARFSAKFACTNTERKHSENVPSGCENGKSVRVLARTPKQPESTEHGLNVGRSEKSMAQWRKSQIASPYVSANIFPWFSPMRFSFSLLPSLSHSRSLDRSCYHWPLLYGAVYRFLDTFLLLLRFPVLSFINFLCTFSCLWFSGGFSVTESQRARNGHNDARLPRVRWHILSFISCSVQIFSPPP